MKRTTIQLLLSALILTHSACSKKDNLDKIKIEETDLTLCPENSECEYLFTENADIEGTMPTFKSGAYRLFWAGITQPGMDSRLYLKAPMQGNSFQLDKSAIAAGRVVLYRSCLACSMFPLKPVDGYVKGINLTPEKPADQTKWLLEAKIILGDASGETSYRDTLYVKQYFYPNFVYN
jgi:hypothetical protein